MPRSMCRGLNNHFTMTGHTMTGHTMTRHTMTTALHLALCLLAAGILSCGEEQPLAPSDRDRNPWSGMALLTATAPDRTTVTLRFGTALPPLTADGLGSIDELDGLTEQLQIAEIGSGRVLPVRGLSLSADRLVLSAQTAPQRLGLSYQASLLASGPRPSFGATFVAADSARFYAIDFASPTFEQYQLDAVRRAVGSASVLYVERGESLSETLALEMVAHFDAAVLRLTGLLGPAPDIDGNSLIVILALDGGEYYGGYFDPTNLYPDEEVQPWGLRSNEMELICINTLPAVLVEHASVLPHEFSHLLYHGAHGFTDPYWDYHDEGLAEVSVLLANDTYTYPWDYWAWDPSGDMALGLSLVHWDWANYDHYVLGFQFWSHVAGRLDGTATVPEVFALPTGHPDEVDAYLREKLGLPFPLVAREALLAAWAQHEGGSFGWGQGQAPAFGPPPGFVPPSVPTGTNSVALEPFAGAFFRLAANEVDYPGTQGADVTYAAIAGDGAVDLQAPFAVAGGALLAFNTSYEYTTFAAQASGPDLPALQPVPRAGQPLVGPRTVPSAWRNPPPTGSLDRERLRRWREQRR